MGADKPYMKKDKQFQAYRLDTVKQSDNGWELGFDGGTFIWCTAEECAQDPQPGEEVRLYGKGFGYPVRGIVIGGRRYRYDTPNEDEVKRAAEIAESTRRREEETRRYQIEINSGKHEPQVFAIKADARNDYERGLANNTDPYGRECYLFAADWAALMEAEIAKGRKVADVAKECSRTVDKQRGITGFMYGMAVGILSHCWEFGDELRRWHNLDTQIGDEGEKANAEGGVLNPALLSVGAR